MLGVVRNLPSSGASQLVGLTLDKILERKGPVQVTGVLKRAFNLNRTFGTRRSHLRTRASHGVKTSA